MRPSAKEPRYPEPFFDQARVFRRMRVAPVTRAFLRFARDGHVGVSKHSRIARLSNCAFKRAFCKIKPRTTRSIGHAKKKAMRLSAHRRVAIPSFTSVGAWVPSVPPTRFSRFQEFQAREYTTKWFCTFLFAFFLYTLV
jgi:hypothetical protein